MAFFGTSPGKFGNVSLLDPGQRALFDQLTTMAQGQVGQPGPVFPGQRVAAQDPLEQQGLQAFGGLLGNQQAFDPSQSLGFLQQAQGPLQSVLADFDPTATRARFQEQFVAPAREAFGDIQTDILERAAGRGAADSGFLNTALAKAGGRLSTQLGSQLANMLFQTEQAQRNRQLAGIGQLGNLSMLPGAIAGQQAGVAGQQAGLAGQAIQAGRGQRAFGQEQINAEMQKFLESQAINNPALRSLIPSILGTQTQQPFYQPGSQGLGSVLGPVAGQFLGSQGFANLLGGFGGGTGAPPPGAAPAGQDEGLGFTPGSFGSLGGAVGTGLGAAFGGPLGAGIGGGIGSGIGQLLSGLF